MLFRSNTDGIPITVSGGSVNFNSTVSLSDYPTQQGAFRCFGCGAGSSATYLNSMTVSGTISGGTASLTFSRDGRRLQALDGMTGALNVWQWNAAKPALKPMAKVAKAGEASLHLESHD